MAKRRVNFGKIVIVIFITVLIWVWADLALDVEHIVSNATIIVAKSNPKFLVTLEDASIEEIVLKGPLKRINELKGIIEEQGGLKFDFDVTEEKMGRTGTHTKSMESFLQERKEIRQLALKVETCKPDTISVNVRELVKKSLTIVCVDENRIPQKTESVHPPTVEMFVPEDWQGERLVANVQLTQREINQAKLSTIEKTPYIELPGGQLRKASSTVEIKMPASEERLKDFTITTATLGFSLSENLQGKYKVQVENLTEIRSSINFRATPEAKDAYERKRYHVILEIDDEDVKAEEEVKRVVVYNFPEEFVRTDEIALNQEPVLARFKLVPIAPESK